MLMQITVHNRGPEAARLHVLPQLWFRNIWSWRPEFDKPQLSVDRAQHDRGRALSTGPLSLVRRRRRRTAVLRQRHQPAPAVRHGRRARVTSKTRFHEYLIQGNHAAVNPAAHRHESGGAFRARRFPPAASATIRTRLSRAPAQPGVCRFRCHHAASRRNEADEFYGALAARHCTTPMPAACSGKPSPA